MQMNGTMTSLGERKNLCYHWLLAGKVSSPNKGTVCCHISCCLCSAPGKDSFLHFTIDSCPSFSPALSTYFCSVDCKILFSLCCGSLTPFSPLKKKISEKLTLEFDMNNKVIGHCYELDLESIFFCLLSMVGAEEESPNTAETAVIFLWVVYKNNKCQHSVHSTLSQNKYFGISAFRICLEYIHPNKNVTGLCVIKIKISENGNSM